MLSAIRASLNTIPYRSINLLGPKSKNAYLSSFVNHFYEGFPSAAHERKAWAYKKNRGDLTKAMLITLNWTQTVFARPPGLRKNLDPTP